MYGPKEDISTNTKVSEAVRRHYDFSRVSPTTAVVEVVAAAADRDALAMEPLAETVRVDALDDLFRERSPDQNVSNDTELNLSYLGYWVTVRGDGVVIATPSESADMGDVASGSD